MAHRSAAPSLLILAAVLTAAALLLAGYGVPVGLGLIVGVLLGLVAALAVFLWLRGGTGRSITFGTRAGGAWHSSSPLTDSSDPPGMQVMQEFGDAMQRTMSVDQSALQRVVVSGQAVEAAGITIELTALEVRADGGVAHLVARARPPASIGHFVVTRVRDDLGTAYVASGQADGGAPTSRITLRFAPRPPVAASEVTMAIDRFADPFGGATTDGPWTFSVGPVNPAGT